MSFKQQSNNAAKLRSPSVRKVSLQVQKNITEGAKNNYALVIKLDLTFLALVSNFLKFSVVFLTAEED